MPSPLRARSILFAAVLPLLVCSCDFGTLDDLSLDDVSQGSDELTVQARAFWTSFTGTDDQIRTAIKDLGGVVDRAGARPVQVAIGDLSREDLGLPSITRDPALGQGVLVITELDCSLDQATQYTTASNQSEIYPDVYDVYKRTFTSDVQGFLAGSASTVDWHNEYTVSVLSRTLSMDVLGGARRVAAAAPGSGTLFMARYYFTRPATLVSGDDTEWNQDYQLEAFYEIAPNKVIHFYALWREFRVTTLTSESDFYINLLLGNLVDFDKRTSLVCRDHKVQPKFD